MDDKKRNNGERGHKWTPIVIAVVGAAFGSLSTVSIYLGTPVGQEIARPNPWTSLQAKAAHDALTDRISHIESDVADHLEHHPDRENQFDRRIATLEAQYAIILQNQARILDRLDAR